MVGAICCSGIFGIWTELAPNIFPKVDKIGPRVTQERPKSVPRGYPPEVPKNRSLKKLARVANHHANGIKMEPQSEKLDYF